MLTALFRRRLNKVAHRAGLRCSIRTGEQWFIERGQSNADKQVRQSLARAFRRISKNVKCAHSDVEALRMADFFLSYDSPAPMVECGCFRGGATAKLSLVARATHRRLIVCDSFEGLPEPAAIDQGLKTLQHTPYERGMFAGSLADVRNCVSRFGDIKSCDFHAGYFEKSLPSLAECNIAGGFVDVDLISSARDCLASLWPRLLTGGRLFFHEARDMQLVRGITDGRWWQDTLGMPTPLLVGAGFGCGDAAPQLAYFDKLRDSYDD